MLRRLLLFIAIAITVTACGGTEYVCADGTTVSESADCPSDMQDNTTKETDTADSPNPKEEIETAATSEGTDTKDVEETTEEMNEQSFSIDQKTQSLFDEGMDRVDSISYSYEDDIYNVRGEQVKIALEQVTNYKQTQPFSHVYINRETGDATGVCEAEDNTWCPEVTTHDADIGDYYVKSPLDWMEEVKGAAHEGKGKQLQKRDTHKISFTTGDVNGTMYLLDYYNVPAKVELPDRTINYQEISINSVKEADVTR